MMSELVSVIIPTYNRAEYLREAIESVLAQTYENFELLILDNCSPDHTPDVVESFKDPRIKYLRHQCNIGYAANWTYGIYWAQGKYLSILGDDDKYKPAFLDHRINAFEIDPCVISAFGPFDYWDENNGTLMTSASLKMKNNNDDISLLSGLEAFKAAVSFQFIGSSLYLSSSVRDMWHSALRGGKCVDELLNNILALNPKNKVAWIKNSDLMYRIHSGQDTAMNRIEVAENGGLMYRILLEEIDDPKCYRIIKKRLIDFLNFHGRTSWDAGFAKTSEYFFIKELKINPFRVMTWLRLFRALLYRVN